MRIIGKGTRDYYDNAGWADQSHIFMREKYDEEQAVKNRFLMPFSFPAVGEFRPLDKKQGDQVFISFGLCLIAGKCFPFMREERRFYNVYGPQMVDYHYDPDEAKAIRESIKDTSAKNYMSHFFSGDRYSDADVFMRMSADTMLPWSVDNKVITGVLRYAQPKGYRDKANTAYGMLNCDGLGDHQLFKAVDPSSAHMMIDGYISGVLTSSPDTVEISDKSRVNKAGFDSQSFRTRPGSHKRRGAKNEETSDLSM